MAESIQCYQCGTRVTLAELVKNHDDCPECGATHTLSDASKAIELSTRAQMTSQGGEAVDTTFIDSAFFPYKAFKFGIEHASGKVNGWRLVPMKPTPEMLQAGADTPLAGDSDDDAPEDYRAVYKAMLAAAPSAGSQEQGE